MNADQTLSLLPGVTVANRTNPSQDTRISVRGFGARSQFGARSIRLLRDGMPLTLPDGQTPIDYLDLESVERVEVIRGAAAALYGNAAGGVIDLRSGPPPDAPFAAQVRSWGGGSGLRRYTGLFGGESGGIGYEGNIGRTQSDGYRDFAQQRLTNAFVHSNAQLGNTRTWLHGHGIGHAGGAQPRRADARPGGQRARPGGRAVDSQESPQDGAPGAAGCLGPPADRRRRRADRPGLRRNARALQSADVRHRARGSASAGRGRASHAAVARSTRSRTASASASTRSGSAISERTGRTATA